MSPEEALAGWGITRVSADKARYRLVRPTLKTTHVTVTVEGERESFFCYCEACNRTTPHANPDDAVIAVCLECGMDRWV